MDNSLHNADVSYSNGGINFLVRQRSTHNVGYDPKSSLSNIPEDDRRYHTFDNSTINTTLPYNESSSDYPIDPVPRFRFNYNTYATSNNTSFVDRLLSNSKEGDEREYHFDDYIGAYEVYDQAHSLDYDSPYVAPSYIGNSVLHPYSGYQSRSIDHRFNSLDNISQYRPYNIQNSSTYGEYDPMDGDSYIGSNTMENRQYKLDSHIDSLGVHELAPYHTVGNNDSKEETSFSYSINSGGSSSSGSYISGTQKTHIHSKTRSEQSDTLDSITNSYYECTVLSKGEMTQEYIDILQTEGCFYCLHNTYNPTDFYVLMRCQSHHCPHICHYKCFSNKDISFFLNKIHPAPSGYIVGMETPPPLPLSSLHSGSTDGASNLDIKLSFNHLLSSCCFASVNVQTSVYTHDTVSYLYLGQDMLYSLMKPFSLCRFRISLSIKCLNLDNNTNFLEKAFNSESLFAVDISGIRQNSPIYVTFVNEKYNLQCVFTFIRLSSVDSNSLSNEESNTSEGKNPYSLSSVSVMSMYQPSPIDSASPPLNSTLHQNTNYELRVNTSFPQNSSHNSRTQNNIHNSSRSASIHEVPVSSPKTLLYPAPNLTVNTSAVVYGATDSIPLSINTNIPAYTAPYSILGSITPTNHSIPVFSPISTPTMISYSPLRSSPTSYLNTSRQSYEDGGIKTPTSKRNNKNRKSTDSEIATILQHSYFNYNLIKGYVYELAQNQEGSKRLQGFIKQCDALTLGEIINECLPYIPLLLKRILNLILDYYIDQFGNYFIQNLYVASSEQQSLQILNQLRNDLVSIAFDSKGTYAIQNIIKNSKYKSQLTIITSSFRGQVLALSSHAQASYVVNRCLEFHFPDIFDFIFKEAYDNFIDMAKSQYGVVILRNIINNKDNPYKKLFIQAAIDNSVELSQHQYGNFIIQHVIDLKSPDSEKTKVEILKQFRGSIIELSMQKYSSNVIEKLLHIRDPIHYDLILDLFKEDTLEQLLQDRYANYVIQAAIFSIQTQEIDYVYHNLKPKIEVLKTQGLLVYNKWCNFITDLEKKRHLL